MRRFWLGYLAGALTVVGVIALWIAWLYLSYQAYLPG